jgi:hypothetical protein
MRISFAALGNSMPSGVTTKRYDEIKRFFSPAGGSHPSQYTRHPGRSTSIRCQIDARRHPRATGPLAATGGTVGGTRDHGSAEGTRTRAASVVAANASSPHRAPPVSVVVGLMCGGVLFLSLKGGS